MTERSAKAFFKEFGKMVENADVIIQVRITNFVKVTFVNHVGLNFYLKINNVDLLKNWQGRLQSTAPFLEAPRIKKSIQKSLYRF